MSADSDLIEVLVHDHREVQQMFAELESGPDPKRRRELVDNVILELVRHSVAEEMYLYPATRKALPDGDEIADHEIDEHASAERIMKQLDGMDPGDPRFEPLVRDLITDVRHHIDEEEGELFPRLAQAVDAETRAGLGRKIQAAKKIAPTHPHPAAPDKPPANKVIGPLTGLVDRMRDALTGARSD